MKITKLFLLTAALTLFLCGMAMAQGDSQNHNVTVTLGEVAKIGINGGNVTLTFNTGGTTPGDLPIPVTDATTDLRWTSNVASGLTRKITAALEADYVTGIVLKITVGAPATGTTTGASAGQITLSTTDQDAFTGITNEHCKDAALSYEVSLTAMVEPNGGEMHQVTYTLTDDA